MNYPLRLLYTYLPEQQCMGLFFTTPKINNMVSRPVRNHKEYISSLATSWKNAMRGESISADDKRRTCEIPVSVGAIDFSISKEKQDEAIKNGRDAMDAFIASLKTSSIIL